MPLGEAFRKIGNDGRWNQELLVSFAEGTEEGLAGRGGCGGNEAGLRACSFLVRFNLIKNS